jgi:hypothetical protein
MNNNYINPQKKLSQNLSFGNNSFLNQGYYEKSEGDISYIAESFKMMSAAD